MHPLVYPIADVIGCDLTITGEKITGTAKKRYEHDTAFPVEFSPKVLASYLNDDAVGEAGVFFHVGGNLVLLVSYRRRLDSKTVFVLNMGPKQREGLSKLIKPLLPNTITMKKAVEDCVLCGFYWHNKKWTKIGE